MFSNDKRKCMVHGILIAEGSSYGWVTFNIKNILQEKYIKFFKRQSSLD